MFKKDYFPTLDDSFSAGISDCYNFISTVINSNASKMKWLKLEKRGFKGFCQGQFIFDPQGIDFCFIRDPEGHVDATYELFENQLTQVVNKHAPIKQAYQRRKKLPYMNSALKREIFF